MARFDNILVPTDFSEPSQEAVRLSMDLAETMGSSLTLVHAHYVPTYVYYGVVIVDELTEALERGTRARLDENLAEVKKRIPRAQAILRIGPPGSEILSAIEIVGPDLVVMGTHGRHGVGRAFLGSVAESIVRMAPASVLTVHERAVAAKSDDKTTAAFSPRHIVAAVDFGDWSAQAVRLATDLAQRFAARLTLLHVCDLPEYVGELRAPGAVGEVITGIEAAARRNVDAFAAAVSVDVPSVRGVLRSGNVVGEILASVDELKGDLIVLGTHGRRGFNRWRLGSVAERIVQSARVPVLTAKHKP